jgi:hypothetical protein
MKKITGITIFITSIFLNSCQVENPNPQKNHSLDKKNTSIKDTIKKQNQASLDVNEDTIKEPNVKENSIENQWALIVEAVNQDNKNYIDSLTKFEHSRDRKHWKHIDLVNPAYNTFFSEHSWIDLQKIDSTNKIIKIELEPDDNTFKDGGNVTLKINIDSLGKLHFHYCKVMIYDNNIYSLDPLLN